MTSRFARTLPAAVLAAGLAVTVTGPAHAAAPRGYVLSASLKQTPSNASATLAVIRGQWVEIRCYTDARSGRWFQAQYYSQRGYLEANLVGSQPKVGRC